MEHSLHLAAKHFVQTVAPHHTKNNASAGGDERDSASDGGKDNAMTTNLLMQVIHLERPSLLSSR